MKKWTKAKAVSWLETNKFKHGDYDHMPNYHSFRQENPDKYVRFANGVPKGHTKDDGIVFIFGFLKAGGSEVQSVRFYHGEGTGKLADLPEFYQVKSIDIPFALKELDTATGRVIGYASSFNVVDSDRDIIIPGAFAKTLEEQGPKGKNRIAHLFQHDTMKVLSKPTSIVEDEFGLLFDSTISQTTWLKDVLILYEDKVINEHSIGFITKKSSRDEESMVRTIQEVQLFDISSVVWGANEFTPTISVKSKRNAENVMEQIDCISRALTRPLTDETAQALELKLKQLKQAFTDLASLAQPPERDTVEPIATEVLSSLREINDLLKHFT